MGSNGRNSREVVLFSTQLFDHVAQPLRQWCRFDVASDDEHRSMRSIHDFTRDISDRVIAQRITYRPGPNHDEIVIAFLDFCEDLIDDDSVSDPYGRSYSRAFDNFFLSSQVAS